MTAKALKMDIIMSEDVLKAHHKMQHELLLFIWETKESVYS